MTKRITITLTEDQIRYALEQVYDRYQTLEMATARYGERDYGEMSPRFKKIHEQNLAEKSFNWRLHQLVKKQLRVNVT